MNPIVAFVIVMAVWTLAEYVARVTKSLLSSLLVASVIFLVGFMTGLFPDDLLAASSLLGLAGVVVGFIIVHLGTMISLDDFKKQWRTFLIGIAAVAGIGLLLLLAFTIFGVSGTVGDYEGVVSTGRDYMIAGIGALSGGTISVLIVQDAALGLGLTTVAAFPVLIVAIQGLIGFPIGSVMLRKEARRLKGEYSAGRLVVPEPPVETGPQPTILPKFLQNTPGTLFIVGLVVLLAVGINNVTDGNFNTFVVALLFGIALRTMRVFRPMILTGIDSFGLMMLAILILVFGPLATLELSDLKSLAAPLLIAFVFGLIGIVGFSALVGKLLGYSIPMSVAIGVTSLFGFPGTMVLSQEAARAAGETEDEVKAIENVILPKMIIAGFATVTITSVIVTGIIASGIGS